MKSTRQPRIQDRKDTQRDFPHLGATLSFLLSRCRRSIIRIKVLKKQPQIVIIGSACKFFLRSYFKYFLPVCTFLFVLLTVSFRERIVFILMESNLSMFSFLDQVFVQCFEMHLLCFILEDLRF